MSENSFTQQLVMNNLSMNSQIMQGLFSTVSNINNQQNKNNTNNITNIAVTNSLGKLAYAVEGDSKYDEEIDTNKDGIITFNEYIKYVTDNMSSKYNIPKNETAFSLEENTNNEFLKFTVTNIGKAFSAYLTNSVQLPSGLIEKEA